MSAFEISFLSASKLVATLKCEPRLQISFSDTQGRDIEAVEAVAKAFRLHLHESESRDVHLIAERQQRFCAVKKARPAKPAFILELLRPRDEASIEEQFSYPVYFGTNRCREGDAFSARRDANLHVGVCRVTLSKIHRFGSSGRKWIDWWRRRVSKLPRKVELKHFESTGELCAAAEETVFRSEDKLANLLFVHGYNTGFDESLRQGAQIGADLKVSGAVYTYSWPSSSRMQDYCADEATIEASIPFLKHFIEDILTATADVPLNILAHSMGSRAVLRCLEAFASGDKHRNHIGQVIFIAPDVDTDVFIQSANKISGLPIRMTLYGSRGDWALQLSEISHKAPRAGLFPPVVTAESLDTILVEGFPLLDLGHGYHREAGNTVHDMFSLLRYNTPPEERLGMVKTETSDGRTYWKLKAS